MILDIFVKSDEMVMTIMKGYMVDSVEEVLDEKYKFKISTRWYLDTAIDLIKYRNKPGRWCLETGLLVKQSNVLVPNLMKVNSECFDALIEILKTSDDQVVDSFFRDIDKSLRRMERRADSDPTVWSSIPWLELESLERYCQRVHGGKVYSVAIGMV